MDGWERAWGWLWSLMGVGGGRDLRGKVSFALFAWASSTYMGFRSRKDPYGIAGLLVLGWFRNFQVFFFFFAIIEGGLLHSGPVWVLGGGVLFLNSCLSASQVSQIGVIPWEAKRHSFLGPSALPPVKRSVYQEFIKHLLWQRSNGETCMTFAFQGSPRLAVVQFTVEKRGGKVKALNSAPGAGRAGPPCGRDPGALPLPCGCGAGRVQCELGCSKSPPS